MNADHDAMPSRERSEGVVCLIDSTQLTCIYNLSAPFQLPSVSLRFHHLLHFSRDDRGEADKMGHTSIFEALCGYSFALAVTLALWAYVRSTTFLLHSTSAVFRGVDVVNFMLNADFRMLLIFQCRFALLKIDRLR
jgi:hypothetical protein